MKQEWTPTQAELDALVRGASARAWRTVGLAVAAMALAAFVVIGPLRGWGTAVAVVVITALFLGMLWFTLPRRMRRVMAACYPVGATLSSEATDEALVLHTGLGSSVVAGRASVVRGWVRCSSRPRTSSPVSS